MESFGYKKLFILSVKDNNVREGKKNFLRATSYTKKKHKKAYLSSRNQQDVKKKVLKELSCPVISVLS